MRPTVCITIHDVAPQTWPACERVVRAIEQVAPVPLTFLFIPAYHGNTTPPPKAFIERMHARCRAGDELALHGFTHKDWQAPTWATPRQWFMRKFYTAGEGEFSALDEANARARISAGLQWCTRFGFGVRGFVAPAWLMSDAALNAVNTFDFDYTTRLHHVIALPSRATYFTPSIVYSQRSAWRRSLSRAWNSSWFELAQRACVLRLELHPGDADHVRLRRHWQGLLERTLQTRDPMTNHQAFMTLFSERTASASQLMRPPIDVPASLTNREPAIGKYEYPIQRRESHQDVNNS